MKCPFRLIADLGPCAAILIIALLAVLNRCSPASAQDDQAGEAVSPFSEDGVPKDWTVRQWDDISKPAGSETSWVVRDGVLHGGEPRGTWLVSEKEYENFELEFEFKLGPLGNSGLALRTIKGRPGVRWHGASDGRRSL